MNGIGQIQFSSSIKKILSSPPFWIMAISVLVLINSGCEKVINIDLNKGSKQYVIEGVITDQEGTSEVHITETKDFDEDNNYPGVSGAQVTISEEGGATTILTEGSVPGFYRSVGLKGVVGKKYTLNVTVAGTNFTAASTMPVKIKMDSLFVTEEFLIRGLRKLANINYKDPEGRGNSYRFVQRVNGLKEETLFIQNDEYTDGRDITTKLYYFVDDDDDSTRIRSGDTLSVDMQCIDPAVYTYWFSLSRSSTGGSGQATPSNPVSNMQGGALGYFSAHTLENKELIVP